jgi:hypothetical protein
MERQNRSHQTNISDRQSNPMFPEKEKHWKSIPFIHHEQTYSTLLLLMWRSQINTTPMHLKVDILDAACQATHGRVCEVEKMNVPSK